MFTLWTNLVKQGISLQLYYYKDNDFILTLIDYGTRIWRLRDISWSFANGIEIETPEGVFVKIIPNKNLEIAIVNIFPKPRKEALAQEKKILCARLKSNQIVNSVGFKPETLSDVILCIQNNLPGWENNKQFLGAEIN